MIGRPATYIDATNLTPQERAPYIGIGRAFGCEMEALYFDIPVEVCRQRNAARHRVVPNDILLTMAAKLVPPSAAEGFARVIVISEPRP
jgi:predicted kinase